MIKVSASRINKAIVSTIDANPTNIVLDQDVVASMSCANCVIFHAVYLL